MSSMSKPVAVSLRKEIRWRVIAPTLGTGEFSILMRLCSESTSTDVMKSVMSTKKISLMPGPFSVHCFEEMLECVELDGRVEGREG
jgi:hypothetical protein